MQRVAGGGRALVLLALLMAPAVQALQVERLDIQHQGKGYRVQLLAQLQVTPERARALLTDYAHLDRVHPELKTLAVERQPDGTSRVSTALSHCVLAVCLTLRHVEQLRESTDSDGIVVIEAVTLPTPDSDFASGHTRWQLRRDPSDAAGTRLEMQAEITPRTWLPPVFGPWMLQRELREQTLTLLQALEAGSAP